MKTNKIFSTLALLFFCSTIFSQALIKKGDKAFETQKFNAALNYYKKAENKGDNSPQTKEKIAQCYFFSGNINQAYEYFQQIETEALSGKSTYIYGMISQKQGKYKEAVALLEAAKANNASMPGIDKLLEACRWANEHNESISGVETSMTDVKLNGSSMGVQYWDNKIVFSAVPDNTPPNQNNKMDLFYASFGNGEFGRPFMLDNTFLYPLREGGMAFTNNGNTMFFSKEEPAGRGTYVFKIYKAEFNGSRWKDVKALNFNSNDFSCAFPTISSNGKTIIFSSNMPGGKGGFDLWIASENNGDWGTPINLKQLNTEGNELYPFIDNENYLFFSSNGHNGFGGLDIFVSPNNNGRWDEIINLMRPINSPMDDFSFVTNPKNNKEGLLLSDKAANSNEVHLYQFMIDRDLLAKKMNVNVISSTGFDDRKKNTVISGNPLANNTSITNKKTANTKNSTGNKTNQKTANIRKPNDTQTNKVNDVVDEEVIDVADVAETDGNNGNGEENNVVFKVQIESSRQPIKNMKWVAGYEPKRYFYKEMYRYTIGFFENVEDAISLQEKAVDAGYHDAFVAAFEKFTLKRLPDYIIYK